MYKHPFEVGQKVVCVSRKESSNPKTLPKMTIGDDYEIISLHQGRDEVQIKVRNDAGQFRWYLGSRFRHVPMTLHGGVTYQIETSDDATSWFMEELSRV